MIRLNPELIVFCVLKYNDRIDVINLPLIQTESEMLEIVIAEAVKAETESQNASLAISRNHHEITSLRTPKQEEEKVCTRSSNGVRLTYLRVDL